MDEAEDAAWHGTVPLVQSGRVLSWVGLVFHPFQPSTTFPTHILVNQVTPVCAFTLYIISNYIQSILGLPYPLVSTQFAESDKILEQPESTLINQQIIHLLAETMHS